MATAEKKEVKTTEEKPVSTPASNNITITIPTPKFDLTSTETQFKFVLLGILFVLLLASFFFFSRSNFATHEIFNFARIQYNLQKLYSISFILFLISISLSLAFGVYFGYGSSKVQAIIGIIIIILASIIAGLTSNPYFYAFLGFGSSVATAIAFASISKTISFSAAWGIISKALLVLLIFAFLGTLVKVNANQNTYYNDLITGLSQAAPSIISGVTPNIASAGQNELLACANAINGVNITRANIESSYPQSEFNNQIIASAGPAYTSLPTDQQTLLSGALYQSCLNFTVASTTNLKGQLVSAITNYNISNSINSTSVSSTVTPNFIEQTINNDTQLNNLRQYLPIVSALAIASVVSLINIVIHIIATILLFLLTKVIG